MKKPDEWWGETYRDQWPTDTPMRLAFTRAAADAAKGLRKGDTEPECLRAFNAWKEAGSPMPDAPTTKKGAVKTVARGGVDLDGIKALMTGMDHALFTTASVSAAVLRTAGHRVNGGKVRRAWRELREAGVLKVDAPTKPKPTTAKKAAKPKAAKPKADETARLIAKYAALDEPAKAKAKAIADRLTGKANAEVKDNLDAAKALVAKRQGRGAGVPAPSKDVTPIPKTGSHTRKGAAKPKKEAAYQTRLAKAKADLAAHDESKEAK